MDKNIFDILTEYAINKRMDDILLQDEEYQKAQKEISSPTDEFNQMGLPKEQRSVIDSLMFFHVESGCCYGRIAYQQGLRDCSLLLRNLELIK